MKTKHWLLILAAVAVIFFFAGRSVIPTGETVVYVKGETVHDSIPVPYPVKEYVPSDPELIYRERVVYNDTGRVIIREVDSLAIVKDYIIKRQYAFNVFDNGYGSLKVDSLNVQYNKLSGFYYTHTPIQKVITRTKEPLFTPFVSGSYNTFDILGIGGGLFYHNFGLEYKYLYQFPTNEKGHEVGVKVKF